MLEKKNSVELMRAAVQRVARDLLGIENIYEDRLKQEDMIRALEGMYTIGWLDAKEKFIFDL